MAYQRKVRIPFSRVCHLSDDEVVIPPPMLFGRGYQFDRRRQVVSISNRFLGFRTSYTQVPFSTITSIEVKKSYHEGHSGVGAYGGESDRYNFTVLMYVSGVVGSCIIAEVSVITAIGSMVSGEESLKRAKKIEEGREPAELIATAIGRVTDKPVAGIT